MIRQRCRGSLRPVSLVLAITLLMGWAAFAGEARDPNALTEDEKKAGFELLFDGNGLDGWQQNGNWVVEDGAISRAKKGGGLTCTVKMIPDDFELRFEWKVGEGSNSGIYYRPGQYEYQILDNQRHRDGRLPRHQHGRVHVHARGAFGHHAPMGHQPRARLRPWLGCVSNARHAGCRRWRRRRERQSDVHAAQGSKGDSFAAAV